MGGSHARATHATRPRAGRSCSPASQALAASSVLWAPPAGRAGARGWKRPCTASAWTEKRWRATRPGAQVRGGRSLARSAAHRPRRAAFGLRSPPGRVEVPGGLTLSFHLLGPPHTPQHCWRPRSGPGEPRCWVRHGEPGGWALGAGREAASSRSRVSGRARRAAQSGRARAALLTPSGHIPHCRQCWGGCKDGAGRAWRGGAEGGRGRILKSSPCLG